MTFTQFSNRQRVDKIRDELENIDRPIYQTYEEFDFTPQYLNSMFKKYTGYSISEYKAKFNYKAGNPLYTI
jgi:YesN/AraC family two-component response regulator